MKVILHHSATRDQSAKDYDAIKRYHVKTNGWSDIGYHHVIEMVGNEPKCYQGRMESRIGAHAYGYNDAIGICIVGNYDLQKPDQRLIDVLLGLLYHIETVYGKLEVLGHCDLSGKTCPGKLFPLDHFKKIFNS